MGSYQGKRRSKLLISISRYTKHLKDMSRGLGSARLIVSFCLESIFMGKRYSSKPLVMFFICLLVVFTCSDNSYNSIRLAPGNNVRR